jgi:heme O synthase-like polyprenyltransferase
LISTASGKFVLGASVATLTLGFFCYYTALFAFRRSNLTARQLLVPSIIYLPAIFAVMMLNEK